MYKGIMQAKDVDGSSRLIVVAVKEISLKDETSAFYDFQHEVMIMRFVLPPPSYSCILMCITK